MGVAPAAAQQAGLRVALLLASTRRGRLNERLAGLVHHRVLQDDRIAQVQRVDPADTVLPLLETPFAMQSSPTPALCKVHDTLGDADALLVVSPEYNRSIPPALKNMLDHFPPRCYAHKPVGVVSYSSGMFGGVRMVEHMRSVFAELGSPMIPLSVSIPRIESALDPGNQRLVDPGLQQHLACFLDQLAWYATALRRARIHDDAAFPPA